MSTIIKGLRVAQSSNPMAQHGPLLPMAAEDRKFWQLWRKSRAEQQSKGNSQ